MKDRPDIRDYFERVYLKTYQTVSRYALFKVRQTADMEDVVAQVYADFYQFIARNGTCPDNISAYLIKMTRHELSRYYRKQQMMSSADEDELEQAAPVIDPYQFDLGIDASIDTQAIWQAIEQLPFAQQQVLIARFRLDMDFKSIAKALCQPESTVKNRLYRSIDKLAKILS